MSVQEPRTNVLSHAKPFCIYSGIGFTNCETCEVIPQSKISFIIHFLVNEVISTYAMVEGPKVAQSIAVPSNRDK